jgi:Type IIA topoisomerase (DNA gyrase/topo II, topoisomerase IV), A subunit
VGMDLAQEGHELLVVTANGIGKRTALTEYPVKGRATGGVITIKLRPNDEVAVARVVSRNSLLTFITATGIVMRTSADGISQLGRNTQGVTILNVQKGDRVAALCAEEPEDEEERSQRVLINLDGEALTA